MSTAYPVANMLRTHVELREGAEGRHATVWLENMDGVRISIGDASGSLATAPLAALEDAIATLETMADRLRKDAGLNPKV